MTLADGIPGNTYKIKDIYLDKNVKRRLEALGMIRGTSVKILTCKRKSAMVIKVRGTRLAIGRKFAEGINTEAWGNAAEHLIK